jgi:hypothetical protein
MKKTEICIHCGGDYIPKRRGVQKFCSNSCRSRHWLLKQPQIKVPAITEELKNQLPNIKSEPKKDAMSFAGVGNAVAGVAAVEVAKSIFTPEDNKPATKKDIKEIKSLISNRYLPVNNLGNDGFGRRPFYDVETGNVEFFYQ